MIPHLDAEALAALPISTTDVIAMMERLVRGADAGSVHAAPKAVILPPDGRYLMATLAAMDDPPIAATKSLVLNDANRDIGLPQINGLVTVLDAATGLPLATMDGPWITGIRTAGLSAVAAKYLARSDSASIGFVGTGLQARTHLDAFADMFPLKRAHIFGRGRANIDRLAEAAEARGLTPEICETAEAAVSAADIVVTTVTHTGVTGPFLDAGWLAPGSFAAVVDLGAPWIKPSFAGLDRLVIDDLAQEAGMTAKLADPAHVHGDMAGLVLGTLPGRTAGTDRTAFVFRGHALGDLALAALAWLTYRG